MKRSWEIERRTFLRGLGVCVGLPLLDLMQPAIARAQTAATRRLVWIYTPNGIMPDGPSDRPPSYLENTLTDVQADVSTVLGLTNQYQNVSGSHFAYWAPFLSGQPTNQPSAAAKTFDQYIAPLQRGATLETTSINAYPDPSPYLYNAIQANNPSWRGADQYVPAYTNPADLYTKLFGNGVPVEVDTRLADQLARRRGVLHYVMDDVRKVRAMAGADDRVRIDEYLEGVNEMDGRLRAQIEGTPTQTNCAAPDPVVASQNYPQRLQSFYDMVYYALRCDLTRVVTFLHASENTSLYHRSFVPGLVTNTTWHVNSHYMSPGYTDDPSLPSNSTDESTNRADYARILAWHNTRIVDFVKRLKATALPGGGTLLDECCVAWGTCLGESTGHDRTGLFWTLAGTANGALRKGARIRATSPAQISNLWLTIMRAFGTPATSLGDASSVISGLLA